MSDAPNPLDDQNDPPQTVAPAAVRLQAETKMIASNIDPVDRVAPSIAKVSIMHDMYTFAAHLQSGSKGE